MSLTGINSQNLITQQYIPFSESASSSAMTGAAVNQNISLQDGFSQLLEKTMERQTILAEALNTATTEQSGTTAPENGKTFIDKNDKLFEMCREFETFLIKNLIKSMRSTIQKTNLVDTGFAGEIYEDMLYDEYAKDFAKKAGFGFAEMAYLELSGQHGKTITRF